MTTPVRRRSRTLRARLLGYITDASGRLRAAWNILAIAQTRLLNALRGIRPGRTSGGNGAAFRAAIAAFNTSLGTFDRLAMAFAERWASTDLPIIYREGAWTLLDNADRRNETFTWTDRHRAAITSVSAQYYADLINRINEALRRARVFLRAVQDAARVRALRFDTTGLLRDHPLDTVVYANQARHPAGSWADATITWQAIATANTGACRTALDELGVHFLEVSDGPQCVMPGGTFLPHGHLKQMVRAWFSGPAYRIARRTSVGTDLITVGPNHPVLTERGWVRAHLLREGDQLVYDRLSEDPATLAELHLEKVPVVEDVYASLVKTLPVSVRSSTRNDLHGDGIFSEGEIHVVDVDRSLLGESDPSFRQHVSENMLVRSDDRVDSLLGEGPPEERLPTRRLAADSVMSSTGTFFPGVGPGVCVPQAESFGTASGNAHVLDGAVDLGDLQPEKLSDLARLASVFDVEASYLCTVLESAPLVGARVATEPPLTSSEGAEINSADFAGGQGARHLRLRLPERFSFSRVESISVEKYEGWVYDATTSGGTFTIDGVIVSNCGWNSHDDPDRANRTLRTVADALAHPAAHPRCIREFLPRMDLIGRTNIMSGAPL